MSISSVTIPSVIKRYESVTAQKEGGAHYTPKRLADFVAAQLVGAVRREGRIGPVRLLDPAVGDGELVMSVLEQLTSDELQCVRITAFDTESDALNLAARRLETRFPHTELDLRCGSFLDLVLCEYAESESSLFPSTSEPFDAIIANPPYVRTQILGTDQAQLLSSQFGLTGRVDLYHAFILGMARVLRPGGQACIIVSNRFMTTKAGVSVRSDIVKRFDPEHVWDLGDTKLFSAAVLPAVLLLRKKDGSSRTEPKLTTIYTNKDEDNCIAAEDAIDALKAQGRVRTPDGQSYIVQQGALHYDKLGEAVWRINSDETSDWLGKVRDRTWKTFGELGGVRVGVKTTADKVFIRNDWETMPLDERPELLRPLTTHFIARRFKALADVGRRAILYSHIVQDGKRQPVDLANFPRSARYLEKHRSILEARKYVTAAGRKWFEIWVPQDPALWESPKLVFRDISERPTFWVDLEGTVINGDCYWLSFPKTADIDLLWLAVAVANSTFIESFYDRCFNNKLYSGRRRFMTQYVEKFPIPDPSEALSCRIVGMAKALYEQADEEDTTTIEMELDGLIWTAFGVSLEKISG